LGAGDAIRSGVGQGHAYRLDSGLGQALRDGQATATPCILAVSRV
jgi:hypothetical protein